MDNIVRRLKENRQIEIAKSILEGAGYKVIKESDDLRDKLTYIVKGTIIHKNDNSDLGPSLNILANSKKEAEDEYERSILSKYPRGTEVRGQYAVLKEPFDYVVVDTTQGHEKYTVNSEESAEYKKKVLISQGSDEDKITISRVNPK